MGFASLKEEARNVLHALGVERRVDGQEVMEVTIEAGGRKEADGGGCGRAEGLNGVFDEYGDGESWLERKHHQTAHKTKEKKGKKERKENINVSFFLPSMDVLLFPAT